MTRIRDYWVGCVFYLYPSRKDAKVGNNVGASGFFIGIPWESDPNRTHVYAVTNKHCISGCKNSVVIRATTIGGGLHFIERDPVEWDPDPANDLSVLPIPPEEAILFRSIEHTLCILEADIPTHEIGPGEEVVMIGRFIKHDGKRKNHPSARFGNLSMLPAPIRQEGGAYQESFAVDMRSISGYSGSPAFVYWTFNSGNLPGAPERLFFQSYVSLLGVDWGHINMRLPVIRELDDKPHPDGLYVESHTSMSGVVPAWALHRLLMDRFKEQRMADESKKKDSNEGGAFDFAPIARGRKAKKTPDPAADAEDAAKHRERFNRLKALAVKRPKSSG